MILGKMTLRDLDAASLSGTRALVRVDYNVPIEDGRVGDDGRIRATLPTLGYLRDHGARVVLLSHLGRPKGKPDPRFSLAPVARRLEELLGAPVVFVPSTHGGAARAAVDALETGGVCLLENTRFHPGEEKNDAELASAWASLGDLYVNDAFGAAHRAHASTAAVAEYVKPAVAGFLMERELRFLGAALESPAHPFVAVLGGAKISGKLELIDRLLGRVDKLCIGGAMACTFLHGLGFETGASLVEPELGEHAVGLMTRGGNRLILPEDLVVAERVAAGAPKKVVRRDGIPAGWTAVDIGPKSVDRVRREAVRAKTVLWNGPVGVFEIRDFAEGTFGVARAVAEATAMGATTILGGGDTGAAAAAAGIAGQV
ncbi:MAG: phosphoglycerate kinase, partial [Gemmatimonadota bacterium]